MFTVFTLVGVVVAAVVATGVTVVVYRASSHPRRALPPPAERTVLNLNVDDAVGYLNRSFVVTGVAEHDDSGNKHWLYRLDDGTGICWLWAARRDEIRAALLSEQPDLTMSARPADSISHEGRTFRLAIWGQTRCNESGNLGHPPTPHGEYFDFHGTGEGFATARKIGAQYVVFVGEYVLPGALELLPGDAVARHGHRQLEADTDGSDDDREPDGDHETSENDSDDEPGAPPEDKPT